MMPCGQHSTLAAGVGATGAHKVQPVVAKIGLLYPRLFVAVATKGYSMSN